MYQPATENLNDIAMFAVLGFSLAALYEPLRIIRLFVKTGAIAAGIQDFLYLSLSGLIVFAYSLEFGDGYFRYFYLLGVAFGAVVYFLTAGRIISFVTRTFANAIKTAVRRFIIRPLRALLGYIAQKSKRIFMQIHDFLEKRGKVLQNNVKIRYNEIQAKKAEQSRLKAQQHKESKKARQRGTENEIKTGKRTSPAIRARIVRSTHKP